MLSPKFENKKDDLRQIINVSRLKSTWKHRVRDAMRRQPIPDPVEHLDFHVKLDAECRSIENEVYTGSYMPRPPIRFLSEKSKGLCRQIVIPTVKDALVLQALSDALWVEIKTKAPTAKSFYAPSDQQFSKRRAYGQDEYGSVNAWLAFQSTIFGFAKERNFIVVTDIANYYDCISYEHLRNVLASLSLTRETALDLLNHVLSHMLWQPDYMPRGAVGLPQMDLDAPRLLAHCFLFEIDKMLDSRSNIDFARYMDDVDIGVDDIASAKLVISDLDLALQTRHIRLNSGKTKILSEAQAVRHFRIAENERLDALQSEIETARASNASLVGQRRSVRSHLRKGLRTGSFSDGNGEKIYKRLLNLGRMCKLGVDSAILHETLDGWPSLRSAALNWWQHSSKPLPGLEVIAKFVRSGMVIDQAATMQIANALVGCRLPVSEEVQGALLDILSVIGSEDPWSFYASVWIHSKYGSSETLTNLINRRQKVWSSSEQASRLVAGCLPLVSGAEAKRKLWNLVRYSGNASAHSVLSFHGSLLAGSQGFLAVRKFLLASNTSVPNRLSHAKTLMILSVLQNVEVASSVKSALLQTHEYALSDPSYDRLVRKVMGEATP